MKSINSNLLLVITLLTFSTTLFASTKKPDPQKQTVTINKGQVLDVLSAIRKPDTDEALNNYFSNVFPSAQQNGFKIDAQFIPIAPPTQGNYHPDFFSLMSWPDSESQDKFRQAAKKLDYKYHDARKEIWSVFNLTSYEQLEENIEFTVTEGKVYVITAYWVDDMESFRKAKEKGSSKLEKAGGSLKLVLGKGHSPMGYVYEPNVISITEWENEEAFDKFIQNSKSGNEGVTNINQWKTQFVFPQNN